MTMISANAFALILPSGEDQLESGDDENRRQQLTKHRSREPLAPVLRANPSTDYRGDGPHWQRGRKLRDAREMAEQSGHRIHENESGGNRGCRPRFGPPHHQDQRAEKNSSADAGESREKSDDEAADERVSELRRMNEHFRRGFRGAEHPH